MGQWFHARSGTLVEVDPAIPGGIDITVPWSHYRAALGSGADDTTAAMDVAEWLELTLASDPSGASFGTPNAQCTQPEDSAQQSFGSCEHQTND